MQQLGASRGTASTISFNQRASDRVERMIERFLSGESDGADVLSLLYGQAQEPVPERFRALLRAHCRDGETDR